MDNFFPDNSIINISDGIIEDISFTNGTYYVTIDYTDCINCRRTNQTVRLVVGDNTLIFDERGNTIPASDLRKGMTVNAAFSSAITRSIPPQSNAFMIRIARRPVSDNITVGRILDIDRRNRSFTTISDGNPSSVIRFNVPEDAIILSTAGLPLNFTQLVPGRRVRVRHASFMTASIPPQTTAFEIRVIG